MTSKKSGRRRFLKEGAALAGLAVAQSSPLGAQAVQPKPIAPDPDSASLDAVKYGRRSRFVTTTREIEPPSSEGENGLFPNPTRPSAFTPLSQLVGIITPSSLHYTTQHEYGIPDINPVDHRLMVHGMVDRPRVFTMEELRRYPYISRVFFLECIGNRMALTDTRVEQSHGRTGCSEWAGVPLSLLLRDLGVSNGARYIIAEGLGGGTMTYSVPIRKVMEDDVLVAFGQNGEPLRPDHGFPLRLIVPGYEGTNQIKWLRRIKVVDRPYLAFQEISRYLIPEIRKKDFYPELGPKSVITSPSGEMQLTGRGYWLITGLAWSGAGAIKRVEVSTDGGRTWADAELAGPVHRHAHARFNYAWKWNGEEALLQSRCTDESGQVQPSLAQFARFWGHTPASVFGRRTPEDAQMSAMGHANMRDRWGHMNFVQTWKVGSDGKVTNGHNV